MSEMPLFERLQGQDHEGEERVFRVAEVNRAVRFTLEDNWANVLVEGELSDVRRAKGSKFKTSRRSTRRSPWGRRNRTI